MQGFLCLSLFVSSQTAEGNLKYCFSGDDVHPRHAHGRAITLQA